MKEFEGGDALKIEIEFDVKIFLKAFFLGIGFLFLVLLFALTNR